jgi:hypothetical protein
MISRNWNNKMKGIVTGIALLAATVIVGCDSDESGEGAPTASFSASPSSVPAGDNHQTIVTLDGSASSDPEGDVLSYSWNVPSGTFVGGTSSSSEIAQVTFPGAAPYTVTLTVTDPDGNDDSTSVTVGLN